MHSAKKWNLLIGLGAVVALAACSERPMAPDGPDASSRLARLPGSSPGNPDNNQSCSAGSNGSNGNSKNDKNQCTWSVSGSLSGLGASKSVVLQLNGGSDLTLTANGAFTFPVGVTSGATYAVIVKTQPAQQACTVTNGSGTATSPVTKVTVTCVASGYTIGGTVAGLPADASVVLQNNGGDDLTVSANGSFTFATLLQTGATYDVTVKTSPNAYKCVVNDGYGGNGTVAAANVTNLKVTCRPVVATIQNTLTSGAIFIYWYQRPNSAYFDCQAASNPFMNPPFYGDDLIFPGATSNQVACDPELFGEPTVDVYLYSGTDALVSSRGQAMVVTASGATCVKDASPDWGSRQLWIDGGQAWKCTIALTNGLPSGPVAITIAPAP